MSNFEIGIGLIEEAFGNNKDNVISLATIAISKSENGKPRPAVRSVNAYYENGTFYSVTHRLSNKMMQIDQNPEVGVSGCFEMFTARGTAEDLGWVLNPKNSELRDKLRMVFSEWYDMTNNEEDNNCRILEIKLDQGTFNYNHWEKLYHIDFINNRLLDEIDSK